MADDIRAFRLLDVEKLENNAATIAEVLFQLPARAVGTLFTISPGGGWISFADPAKLATDAVKNLPPTATDAKAAALRFFAERRAAMITNCNYLESGLPSLIPLDDHLGEPAIFLIPHPRKRQFDHWLCRFGLEIRSSDDIHQPQAEILGAGVDLRIGDGGEVIAATWRWRPPVETRSRPRLAPPERARRIVYKFNDEAARQTFLAPYYEVVDGEDVALVPASDRSLRCVITGGNGKLFAAVDGGTGDYSYTWGRIAVTSFPPVIEILRSTGSEADFGIEAGDVLLHIRDNGSDAVIQLRRAIYPTMFGPDVLL